MSLASVRGVAGAVCLWAWVLAVLFMGRKFAIFGGNSLPIGSVQVAAFGGLACGLLLVVLMVRRGGRGPEPSRGVAIALGCVPPLLMLAAELCVGFGGLPYGIALVPWVLSGASAAYSLRRALALGEVLACGLPNGCGLRLYAGVLGGAAVAGGLMSRMDAFSGLAVTFVLIPLSLVLLPQGRLSIAPRTEASRSRLREARSQRPPQTAAVTACLMVTGLVFGFQTSVGDVLYAATETPTVVYVVLLAAALVVGLVVGRLPLRLWRPAVQGLCALSVVAIVPMLFLTYDPSSLLWLICQNALLLCTACCCGVLGFALARGGFGSPRETNGMPGLVGTTLFLATLLAGRVLGTVLACGSGVGSAPFEGAVLGFSAALLACVFALGWGVAAPEAAVAPARQPKEDVPAAVDGEPAQQRPDAGPLSPGWPAPESPAVVNAAIQGAVPASKPVPETSPVLRRCNEVAWHYGLSEREHDVLILLSRGLNAQQVAERMVVSRNTVKSHMAHIYAKLGIHTRAELDALLEDPASAAK